MAQPAKRAKPPKQWRNLPELDLCETDAHRRAVIKQVERSMMPRTVRGWIEFVVFALLILYGPYFVLDFIMSAYMPVGRPRTYITFGGAIVVYTIIVVILIRRDMPKMVRTALNEAGVPVCEECGYGLEGLPAETERCPECGWKRGTKGCVNEEAQS